MASKLVSARLGIGIAVGELQHQVEMSLDPTVITCKQRGL